MDRLFFTPVTPEAREIVTSFTLHSYGQICDLAFANLYGWAVKYETCYATVWREIASSSASPPPYVLIRPI